MEDLVGGLAPHEGARVVVPRVDRRADVGFQCLHGLVGAALQLLGGQLAEPLLHQVEAKTRRPG